MRLAVIPARGGSKRIPRKNIKSFAGKPMIHYPIITAQKSCCFDKIIVSTDDPEISKISLEYGADVPFKRPEELSDDHTSTAPVISHAIQYLQNQGFVIDEVCCIYATTPMLTSDDIKRGLELLHEGKTNFVFTATSYPFPIERAFHLDEEKRAKLLWPENHFVRSQDLREVFHDAGQFYWGTTNGWLQQSNMYDDGATPLILPSYRTQDIDTEEDWIRAELMFKAL